MIFLLFTVMSARPAKPISPRRRFATDRRRRRRPRAVDLLRPRDSVSAAARRRTSHRLTFGWKHYRRAGAHPAILQWISISDRDPPRLIPDIFQIGRPKPPQQVTSWNSNRRPAPVN